MKLRFVLLALCLLLLSVPTFAQELVEWGDYGLAVEVPDNWDIDDSGDDAVLLLSDGDMRIYFWEPYEGDDPEQALVDIAEDEGNSAYDFSDVDDDLEIMGEEAFRLYFESEDISGFIVYFEYDDMLFSVNAVVDDDRLSSGDEDDLLEVVLSIQETSGGGNGGQGGGGGGDVVESAADEDSSGEDIVDELIELGLVSDGGDFLFSEDEVDEDSQELPESYEGGRIALGALISYERAEDDEEYRICGFIAQATTDDMSDDEGTLMITGLDSDSAFVTFELDIEDMEGSIFQSHDSGVDVEDQNHLLVIIQEDTLSAYVNGELILEEWELDIAAGDDELFAGYLADLGCTMTNVWGYTFE
jgi:hypothetical protein